MEADESQDLQSKGRDPGALANGAVPVQMADLRPRES